MPRIVRGPLQKERGSARAPSASTYSPRDVASLSFRSLVEADPDVTSVLTPEAVEHCFDDLAWLTHVKDVIARLERLDP